jgi:hypothetical protein
MTMFRSRSAKSAILLTGLTAGIVAVGCTREAASSGAAAGDAVRAADSAPPAADSSPPLPAPDTPPAPAPRKPVGHPVPKSPSRTPVLKRVTTDTASPPAATPATAPTAADKWLSYDAATNTVTLELIAGPFTFNGYRNGEGSLVVPSKANMVINFVNKDGTPHSALVISGDGPIPNAASDPVIPRAYTNKVLEGLPQEAGDVMRFPVPESGTYRIFCGVPGHGLSGMWIWLRVDPAAKAPSFGPTKS